MDLENRQQLKEAILVEYGGAGKLIPVALEPDIRRMWREESLRQSLEVVAHYENTDVPFPLTAVQQRHRDLCHQQGIVHFWGTPIGDDGIYDGGQVDLGIMFEGLYNQAYNDDINSPTFVPLTEERNQALWDICSPMYYSDDHYLDSSRELLHLVEKFMGNCNHGPAGVPAYRQVQHYVAGYIRLSREYMDLLEQEELARQTLKIDAEP